MRLSKIFLLAAGILSFFAAALHVAILIFPQWSSIFGESNPPDLAAFRVVTLGVTLLLATWGFYGLSGAGLIRRLPLLRPGILVIGAIYITYGLLALSRLFGFAGFLPPSSVLHFQDFFVALGALTAGLFYCAGLAMGWKHLAKPTASA
jgi:hypothetical protein